MKQRLNSLTWMLSVTCGGNLAASLQWSIVVAASCCGDGFSGRDWETSQGRGKDERSKVQRYPLWKPTPECSGPQNGAEGSPTNRAATLSTQPRQCRSGFRKTLGMSLSGPARARTWTRSNIFAETWKYLCSNAHYLTWRSCREEWEKLPNTGVPSL